MQFSYKLRSEEGKIESGIFSAKSEQEALKALESKGKILFLGAQKSSQKSGASSFLEKIPFLSGVKPRDIVVLFRQLSTMINATVPLAQALDILHKQTDNKKLKEVFSDIRTSVKGGEKFSDAVARYPFVFNDFYVAMIRSGEASGKLDDSLDYLATQIEKDYDTKGKIKAAMMYPAFIFGALVFIGFGVMIFIVPQLTSVIAESGGELPTATRMLMAGSDFLRSKWYVVLIGMIGVFIGFNFFKSSKVGKSFLSEVQLKVPVFKKIFTRVYLSRLTRSFSTLNKAGLPLLTTLQITHDVVSNNVYQKVIKQAMKDVESGDSMAKSFMNSSVMPVMVGQMISVGEKTGQMADLMDKLSDFFSKELENSVKQLSSMLEPIIFMFLGVGAFVLVYAVLMPIYNMSQTM